jgi:hypothetical protein
LARSCARAVDAKDEERWAQARRRRRRSRLQGSDDASHGGSELRGGSQRPYFERLDEVNGSFDRRDGHVRRLELELEEAKRTGEESRRRLSALEYINDDLERRLESEACRRLDLERELQKALEGAEAGRAAAVHRFAELERSLRAKAAVEDQLTEKLRRLERELYRMHQKKHEIVLEARRQEAQERAEGAEAAQRIRAQASAATGAEEPPSAPGSAAAAAAAAAPAGSRAAAAGPHPAPRSGAQEGARNPSAARHSLQDEAMAVAYFSRPSPALAEEQNRFRMTQALGRFLGCSDLP